MLPAPESLAWVSSVIPEFDPNASSAPQPLPGAGSDRRLCRLFSPSGSLILAENPYPPSAGLNENDSLVYLAAHLRERGLPVPAVHAYERRRGLYLMEDLGDHDLFGEVRAGIGGERLRGLYCEAIDLLVRMQTDGAVGFDTGRCHSPPRYDRSLMLVWESGYFQREFLSHYLGLPPTSAKLAREFGVLAERASRAGTGYFLHRDFQSRNLKLHRGGLWIIDFQGGRLGPPQYDLSALLLDPYVELPKEVREDLTKKYLEELHQRTGIDRESFLENLPYLSAHRLMQALGAYAFLGRRRGKVAFLKYIPSALRLLEEMYRLLPAKDFTELGRALATARERAGEES